ncbi:MAG: hypothetical protein ABL956_02760 [Hyphomonadaceae bacterium]
MKDALAEQLLAKVMSWDTAQVTQERASLQDMARYKYDEYLQFAPGQRFIESLALWLRQFAPGERPAAYDFFRKRLVFCGAAEMRHLVDAAFPCAVRPRLLQLAAEADNLPAHRIKAVFKTTSYKALRRRTLFLGLSDGARTDMFRRANPDISNEQIWHAYDFSERKAGDLGKELKKDLKEILGRDPTEQEAKFRIVCLLDDFTGSGRTYLRPTEDGTAFSGKIAQIMEKLRLPTSALAPFLDVDRLETIIVIYIASAQAVDYLTPELEKLAHPNERIVLKVIHALPPEFPLHEGRDDAMLALAGQDKYFDPAANTKATAVGGQDVRLGFSDGRLPLVLHHNTPNNSIYLLWAEPWHDVTALFPRVSRHRNVS